MTSLINQEQTAIITSNVILKMHYLFLGDQQVFMCRQLLLNKVFENGITLCSGSKKCKDVAMDKNEMDNVWLPLAKDIIDSIMMIGIVAIRFENDIPYVPKVGTYNIHVKTTVSGISKYELHDMDNPMDPVPGSLVLSGYGYDPRPNGTLISMIKNLEPVMLFVHKLSDAALHAEETRCNPPIIVERREKATDTREGLDFDFYMDADTLKSNLNSQYQRDEKAVKQLQNQRKLFHAAISGVDSRSKATTSNAMDNIVPLPNEYHVGTVIEPSGRNDYTQITRNASEIICSVLGVPRSMMISDNIVRGDIQGSHDVFKQSCLQWKGIVGKILTILYRLTKSEDEAARLKKISKKRKLSDIKNFAEKEMIEVIIPVTPYISNEELKDMYLHQIIDWKTYKEYILRNASLPFDVSKSDKDPWSTEDKKELLGITQKPEPLSEGGALSKSKNNDSSGSSSSGNDNRVKAKNK